jgi:hypothetical protein
MHYCYRYGYCNERDLIGTDVYGVDCSHTFITQILNYRSEGWDFLIFL